MLRSPRPPTIEQSMTTISEIPKIEDLKSWVEAEGLELFGIVELGEEKSYVHFVDWLKEEKHAGMEFLNRYHHCRKDPRNLHSDSKTAIIIGLPYYQGDRYSLSRNNQYVRISQYARLRDYHKLMKKRLERVLAKLINSSSGDHSGRVVIDSAPVLERALAAKTSKGFIGKNTLFIHPQKGSFFLLGEIISTLNLRTDKALKIDPKTRNKELGGCGSCKRCQINCPTGALNKDYSLDANLCLSYYSIEHRGPIPLKFWKWFKLYLFGCDICQLVCPYNRNAKVISQEDVKNNKTPPLDSIALMDQKEYEFMFGGTPMTRAKIDGLQRNAIISMVVTKHPKLEATIKGILKKEPSKLVLETIAQIPSYHSTH